MYEKTIYVAEDGKEFEDWRECFTYEKNLITGNGDIKFFATKDGELKELILGIDIKSEYDVEGTVKKAEFITLSDSRRLSSFSELVNEEYGIRFILNKPINEYDEYKTIVFIWDDSEDAFVDAFMKDNELYIEWCDLHDTILSIEEKVKCNESV